MAEPLDIAVIGMACVYPGAPDLATFWRNIESGHDAIRDVPHDRLDAAFFAGEPGVDRLTCRAGGFLPEPLEFDAAAFGVMPRAAEGADPDQLLALQVASRCLADAGYDHRPFDRQRTAVVLGRGGYLTPGLARVDQNVRGARQLVEALRVLVPGIPDWRLAQIKAAFQERAGVFGPDTAIGLVPNLAASRIGNRLDLRGPAYTVDAACASSLVAIDHACRDIASGRSTMALAGGVHVTQDPTFWAVFTQLGALSAAGKIRPFDRRADGLLIGEGCGMVLLKDTREAQRDGDRIYARIRGVGVASDGRSASLFSPRVEGQVASVEAAWREAGIDTAHVGLVEGHGTGTPAGDAAEIETLRRAFPPAGDGPRTALGSVKSMIGHAMPAAGVAGIIKAVLALHHGVLPPSLHCTEPHPSLQATRFRVLHREEPWPETPRRVAGVSAFGFGGINAHVVLESRGAPRPRRRAQALAAEDAGVVLLQAESTAALLQALDAGIPRGGDGPCRLAVLEPTPERLSRARRIVEQGTPWRGRHGIWFSAEPLAHGGKLAFLYPGVEAVFEPEVYDLAARFGLRTPSPTRPRDLEEKGRGVVSLSLFLHRVLADLGVTPDLCAGHSIGEWTGMITSGILDEAETWRLIDSLRPGSLEVPGVLFAAAGAGRADAEEAMQGLPEIALSHDNCPHQVILCGRADSVETARDRLLARGKLCQVLPFRSGFHSPLFLPYLEPHRAHFGALPMMPARVPMWSATTCRPYPSEPDAVRALALDHLVTPIRFRELVEELHAAGVRIFVQVGLGSLTGFVEDVLKGRPHLAVSACEHGRSGLAQVRNLALGLMVEGVAVKLDRLLPPVPGAGALRLDLGSRLVRLHPSLAAGQPLTEPPEPRGPGSKVVAAFEENVLAFSLAQQQVVSAFQESLQPDEASEQRSLSVYTVPDLRDHAFFPQPTGWSVVSDLYPVVPMTMTVELLMEIARRVAGPLPPVAVQDLEAFRWLLVEPEIEVTLRARRVGHREVDAEVEDYARGRILFDDHYPSPPESDRRPLQGERRSPIDAAALYAERYMFHGPRYRGVASIEALGDDGIRGVLRVSDAPGALLDNAGQLMGYWVMATQPQDQLAMPLGIQRIAFFGPPPPAGGSVACTVRIRRLDALEVHADMELVWDGRVWARITDWTDLRFTSDARMWDVMRQPEHRVLSESRPGYVVCDGAALRAPSRDWLMRRYLGEHERGAMFEAGPRRQRSFLNGRIAAKDAVRQLLWASGHGQVFPAEVRFFHDESGRPRVEGFAARDLRVSISHSGDVAVAAAAEGVDVGIDVERIGHHPEGFDELAFDSRDRQLLDHLAEGDAARRDEWRTRLWCAKEAVAKAHGTGLGGQPAKLFVARREGDRLLLDGVWVETHREGEHIVAVTDIRKEGSEP